MLDQPTQPHQSWPVQPVQPAPRPPAGRRLLPLWIALAVLALAGAVVGALAAAGVFGSATFTLRGSIEILNDNSFVIDPQVIAAGGDGGGCQGAGGYDDLTAGSAVTVQDGQGHVVATGALGSGVLDGTVGCRIPFAVSGVPDGDASYAVTVTHRGTRVVPSLEAHAGVAPSIGGN